MSEERFICKKCGNDKRFYTDCTISAKIEYDPYNYSYGDVFDINIGQVDSFGDVIYCRECDEVVE